MQIRPDEWMVLQKMMNSGKQKRGARLLTSRFNSQRSTFNSQPTINFFLPKPVYRGKIASWLAEEKCHLPCHAEAMRRRRKCKNGFTHIAASSSKNPAKNPSCRSFWRSTAPKRKRKTANENHRAGRLGDAGHVLWRTGHGQAKLDGSNRRVETAADLVP